MASRLGVWLKDYKGNNWRLQSLSRQWRHQLRQDYIQAYCYTHPEDIYVRIEQKTGPSESLRTLCYMANEVRLGRLETTASRFKRTSPDYRTGSDVPDPYFDFT